MVKKYKDPVITKTAVIIELDKPIYGSFFGIWDKWLNIAKRGNLNLIVKTSFGTATYKYADWKKGAKKMERYFKNPDVPMVFYGRDVLPDIKKREDRKKQEKLRDMDFNREGAQKLLEIAKKLGITKST